MAISYVGGQVAGRANPSSAVSVNFSLTGGSDSAPAAGDLVVVTVVVGSAGGNPTLDVVTPTGYTPLTQLNRNPTTADTSLQVSYKIMGGTPDTSVTIPGTTNNAWAEAYSIQVFRGVDSTTPMDVTPTSATGSGTNNRPDPPSITPATAGAWVVICGGGAAGTGASYTAPTNFTTDFLTANGADSTDATVGSGYWTGWTSGAVNPAAYGGGSVNAANSWCAYSLVLRPATATQYTSEPAGSLSFSGAEAARTARAIAAALTAAGSTQRAASRSVLAALAPSGAVARAPRRELSATAAFSAALAASKLAFKAVSGALSFAGSVASAKFASVALGAALSFAGAAAAQARRSLAASLGAAGSLARGARRAVAASVPLSASLARRASRPLSASLALAGSASRAARRALAGALAHAGSLASDLVSGHQYAQALSAALSFAGSTSRSARKAAASALAFAASFAAYTPVKKALSAALGFASWFTMRTPRPPARSRRNDTW